MKAQVKTLSVNIVAGDGPAWEVHRFIAVTEKMLVSPIHPSRGSPYATLDRQGVSALQFVPIHTVYRVVVEAWDGE